MLNKIYFFLSISIAASSCLASDQDIASVFKDNAVNGTMVISSREGDIMYIHNDVRANERLSPASTFKIANSLIAIEEKVLHDQHETIPWDGKEHSFVAWNADQNLKSAFKSSCLWFYQEIAQNIGKEKYASYLKTMGYGNQQPEPNLTTFWLTNGNLKISPLEQVEFIKNVNQKRMNISDKSFRVLKSIMLDECHDNYSIYAKTGAATKDWVGHGWYVGYIEVNNQTWYFATNILINNRDDLNLRKQITLTSFKKKGII